MTKITFRDVQNQFEVAYHYWSVLQLDSIGHFYWKEGNAIVLVVDVLGFQGKIISNPQLCDFIIYSGYINSDGNLQQQPYKEGTSLQEILEDGWSRGVDIQQTVDEANYMGHTCITFGRVQQVWNELDKKFDGVCYNV